MPVAHTTTVRQLGNILTAGELTPADCSVFGRAILYLYYGSAFYRSRQGTTRDATWLPVAFLFSSAVTRSARRYYPFDTGALAANQFGPWTRTLTPFRLRFRVPNNRRRVAINTLVHHLYGSNRAYLLGRVRRRLLSRHDPLPLLFDFLRSDLSPYQADARQCAIECQFERPVRLDTSLLWVGLPQHSMIHAHAVTTLTAPARPEFFPYHSHAIFHPREICARLQAEAESFTARQGLI